MINLEENDKKLIVLTIIVLLIGLLVYYGAKSVDDSLKKYGIFSLAKIIKPGRQRVEFEFWYKNKIYYGHDTKVDRNQYIGEIIFVNFLPFNTKTNKLVLDKPVPNCIDIAPYNGWKEIPKDTCLK